MMAKTKALTKPRALTALNQNKKMKHSTIETTSDNNNFKSIQNSKKLLGKKKNLKGDNQKPLFDKVDALKTSSLKAGKIQNKVKKKRKVKKVNVSDVTDTVDVKQTMQIDAKENEEAKSPQQQKPRWTNKQRVLIFCSRGVSYRDRHLMNDLRTMLPHSKPDSKMDKRDSILAINEICEMKNCNKCLYFEARKKKDLYLWVSNVAHGPSVKFLVENVHTQQELRLTGNCLKGSRAIVSFDKTFDKQPQWRVIRELLTQIFSTPLYHPKSQPFTDHVITFTVHDNRVWFRNYQIVDESDGALAEIGPRFALNPIRIFNSSFGGATLYENPNYVSPNMARRAVRLAKSGRYMQRVQGKAAREERQLQSMDDAANTANANMDDIYDNVD